MKGLDLCEAFYREAVRATLDARFPGLDHSAARLGGGSDVLGFDDETSRDHDWGPKLDLFVDDAVSDRDRAAIAAALAEDLPREFRGFATRYRLHDDGTADFSPDGDGSSHGVYVTTAFRWFTDYIGFLPTGTPSIAEWLSVPPQKLRTIAAGRVFHDGLGVLEPIREAMAWYPSDLWLYLMANQWRRIDQEEPFVGRCGDVGDDLGSRIVSTRLVTDVMRLCFLLKRVHAPTPSGSALLSPASTARGSCLLS